MARPQAPAGPFCRRQAVCATAPQLHHCSEKAATDTVQTLKRGLNNFHGAQYHFSFFSTIKRLTLKLLKPQAI